MNGVLDQARDALELMRRGRAAIAAIADAVKDGRAALSTTDQATLDRLLVQERQETKAAHTALDDALTRAANR